MVYDYPKRVYSITVPAQSGLKSNDRLRVMSTFPSILIEGPWSEPHHRMQLKVIPRTITDNNVIQELQLNYSFLSLNNYQA